tara:strand:- start:467 stop:1456 length:990 start_codon:yes stop_codon:yes gene_type:complete
MKRANWKQISLLIIGLLIFSYILVQLGGDSVKLIKTNFNIKYLLIYLFVASISFFPFVWRWQIILSGYGYKISFLKLLKMQISGFALSYITPSARVGGEPLRVYMLNKECNVDYKTGTASVILDKYMEFLGATTFGLIGLFLLFITPNISIGSRFLLLGIIFGSIFILGSFYHRLIKNKPVFFSLFSLFLSRKRLKKFSKNLKEVDKKMTYFVTHHKREFFLSYAFYFISAVIFIMEFKYLLLSFGVSITLLQLILVIIVLGIASYIPLPMALGSLEAGQSGIFQLLMNDGSIGLALSLIHRVKSLAFSAIGIILIFLFGGKEFFKKDR